MKRQDDRYYDILLEAQLKRKALGIFRDHRCWKCNDGEKPCVEVDAYRCQYPHARND
jgi:hypothetical protein